MRRRKGLIAAGVTPKAFVLTLDFKGPGLGLGLGQTGYQFRDILDGFTSESYLLETVMLSPL